MYWPRAGAASAIRNVQSGRAARSVPSSTAKERQALRPHMQVMCRKETRAQSNVLMHRWYEVQRRWGNTRVHSTYTSGAVRRREPGPFCMMRGRPVSRPAATRVRCLGARQAATFVLLPASSLLVRDILAWSMLKEAMAGGFPGPRVVFSPGTSLAHAKNNF